jgi:hypothetical protein
MGALYTSDIALISSQSRSQRPPGALLAWRNAMEYEIIERMRAEEETGDARAVRDATGLADLFSGDVDDYSERDDRALNIPEEEQQH